MMKTTVTRLLVISAAYLCVATYLAECTCSIKTGPFAVYYTPSGGTQELCIVYIDYCHGHCYTYYDHRPHLTDANYAEPDKNCKWSRQFCRIEDHDVVTADLEFCSPVGGGTSQSDPNNPWTVNVESASVCGCGSTEVQEGASHCPLSFAGD